MTKSELDPLIDVTSQLFAASIVIAASFIRGKHDSALWGKGMKLLGHE
jgi:hypothetical protein